MGKGRGLGLGLGLGLLLLLAGCGAPSLDHHEWKAVSPKLDNRPDLTDVAFIDDKNGWVVGSKSTLLRTEDGGETWKAGTVRLDSDSRFVSVSFSGPEGWLGGEPRRLLHTVDGGKSWSTISLDRRIPGNPIKVSALGPGTAEVVLDAGLVLKTVNGGKNWKLLTPASAGGIRSAQRMPDGSYWVVSTRGGSYLQWKPGDPQWTNYERTSSRRIQSMGFSDELHGWMINQGGEMQVSSDGGKSWTPSRSVILNGIGLLDADYIPGGARLWAVGGNGTLIVSADGGKSWQGDDLPDVKTNLLNVAFIGDKGFVLGQNGLLLKYQSPAK